jgi:two-component system cell cycle sensor histidine kinase/response regulator CckA
VVDDEKSVRLLVFNILTKTGHSVLQAEDGLAAYDLVGQVHRELKLVITDVRMPRMDGAELTRRLREEHPDISILCMSGYADPMSPNGHYFLAKPFQPAALMAIVRDVLEVLPENGQPA